MYIDPHTAVDALLKQGAMLKAYPNSMFPTPKSHCVILLNVRPHLDETLVFASASAQYTKRIEQAELRGLPVSTVVMIPPSIYHHLPKYTAIDCNYLTTITKGELVSLYSQKRITFYKNNHILSKSHLTSVIKGSLDSPLVLPELKNLIS